LTTDAQIALNYRCILERLKKETNAKIVILSPYALDAEDKSYLHEDLKTMLPIVRELAAEYADVYIPLDGLLAAEFLKHNPTDIAGDGVHPSGLGAEIIGKIYADYFEALL
jgi:lysophospholipase L1-like esterase